MSSQNECSTDSAEGHRLTWESDIQAYRCLACDLRIPREVMEVALENPEKVRNLDRILEEVDLSDE